MISKIAFLILFGIALSIKVTEMELAQEFTKFIDTYDREYSSVEETIKRYKIFSTNYKYIVEHNSKPSQFELGVNEFADLTLEEFKTSYLNYKKTTSGLCTKPHKSGNSSSEIDWRNKNVVARVKNQGSCGSCWAFSAVGSLEGLNAISKGKLIEFSEQELVDCARDKDNQGCNGGEMTSALEYVRKNGISTEAEYQYEGRDGRCRKKSSTLKILDCVVPPHQDNERLLEALNIEPVSVAVEAGNYSFMFYRSGIFNSYKSTAAKLDHGVLLVGASGSKGVPYWIVKNSWGRGWGQKGYIYIERTPGKGPSYCGIAEESVYPVL